MCVAWSVIAAAIVFRFSRRRRVSLIIGLMVFSHWLLDFIVYPIIPVFFDNSHLIGLGLMTSGPGFIASFVLEVSLIAGGVVTYVLTRKRTASRA